ncbi:MAG: Uma2 family endonuclease [Minicystis sp.]
MVAAAARLPAIAADLARLLPDVRAEIIDGEIVEKAEASPLHANAQGTVVGRLHGPYHRRAGGGPPGGWWILPEVEVELGAHQVYRPDIAGWRRDRIPELPRQRPMTIKPDWVCEVISPSNASNDLVRKLRIYHQSHVDHYWIVDPQNETLTVLRWTPDGYLTALTAGRADRVRAEPFVEVELPVGALFGDEGD